MNTQKSHGDEIQSSMRPNDHLPSRRDFLVQSSRTAAGIGIAAVLGNLGTWALSWGADNEPIKVGVLHSLSGTMAISEVSLKDVVSMAVQEINAKGGVLGRQLKLVVVDPASNWDLFAEKAKQLLVQEKVAVVFGCWTSVSRKSVLPIFEEHNGLLFYPVQYEGEECSKNVFYTGAAVNQQAVPAVEYLMSKEGGGYKKFYLLGTDYVYPKTTNKILRAMLLAKKVPAANIMEEYTPFHHQDYQTIVGKIKKFAAGGAPVSSARSTATATCHSTKSLPIRACVPKTRRSWRSASRRMSCVEWTRPRWSAIWRPGTITRASIRRRTNSLWPISRRTAKRTIFRTARNV